MLYINVHIHDFFSKSLYIRVNTDILNIFIKPTNICCNVCVISFSPLLFSHSKL